MSTIQDVTGATILGDGKIALILDLGVLVREGAVLKAVMENNLAVQATEDDTPTIWL